MTISQDEIQDCLPEGCRSFFVVSAATLSDEAGPVVDALVEAASIIERFAHLNKRVDIVIAGAPFVIPLASGTLRFEPAPQTIHAWVAGTIFLDFNKMVSLPHQLRVATILEELAHAVMNINDETLVSKVVAAMYPCIKLNDQLQYFVP